MMKRVFTPNVPSINSFQIDSLQGLLQSLLIITDKHISKLPSSSHQSASKCTPSHLSSASLSSVNYCLQVDFKAHSIMVLESIAMFTVPWLSSESANSLYHYLQIRTTMALKCISKHTCLWPPMRISKFT